MDETIEAKRIDAEYFQPKYNFLEQKIKSYSYGWDYLGNKFEVETGAYSSEYFSKAQNLKFYIRNTNLVNSQIQEDKEYYVNPNNFTKFTTTGDILTARVGAIGSFGIVEDELSNSVYSDNVLRLRFKTNQFMFPKVYTLYFNSFVNRELMYRLSGGTVQPLITQTSIRKLIIPVFSRHIQNKVNFKILESFTIKLQAQQILEVAKKVIEKLIIDNEERAINWMNEQYKKLNLE